jgi:hypothetical protein
MASISRRVVSVDDLPRWVRNEQEATPHRDPSLWTVDETGQYEGWIKVSIFTPKAPRLPDSVDPGDVVDWYALPGWVKGSYRTEAEMKRLQSFTWVGKGETFFAYTPEGEYAGTWGRE